MTRKWSQLLKVQLDHCVDLDNVLGGLINLTVALLKHVVLSLLAQGAHIVYVEEVGRPRVIANLPRVIPRRD